MTSIEKFKRDKISEICFGTNLLFEYILDHNRKKNVHNLNNAKITKEMVIYTIEELYQFKRDEIKYKTQFNIPNDIRDFIENRFKNRCNKDSVNIVYSYVKILSNHLSHISELLIQNDKSTDFMKEKKNFYEVWNLIEELVEIGNRKENLEKRKNTLLEISTISEEDNLKLERKKFLECKRFQKNEIKPLIDNKKNDDEEEKLVRYKLLLKDGLEKIKTSILTLYPEYQEFTLDKYKELTVENLFKTHEIYQIRSNPNLTKEKKTQYENELYIIHSKLDEYLRIDSKIDYAYKRSLSYIQGIEKYKSHKDNLNTGKSKPKVNLQKEKKDAQKLLDMVGSNADIKQLNTISDILHDKIEYKEDDDETQTGVNYTNIFEKDNDSVIEKYSKMLGKDILEMKRTYKNFISLYKNKKEIADENVKIDDREIVLPSKKDLKTYYGDDLSSKSRNKYIYLDKVNKKLIITTGGITPPQYGKTDKDKYTKRISNYFLETYSKGKLSDKKTIQKYFFEKKNELNRDLTDKEIDNELFSVISGLDGVEKEYNYIVEQNFRKEFKNNSLKNLVQEYQTKLTQEIVIESKKDFVYQILNSLAHISVILNSWYEEDEVKDIELKTAFEYILMKEFKQTKKNDDVYVSTYKKYFIRKIKEMNPDIEYQYGIIFEKIIYFTEELYPYKENSEQINEKKEKYYKQILNRLSFFRKND